jgi:ATP-binding cassette subfamily C protein LapB
LLLCVVVTAYLLIDNKLSMGGIIAASMLAGRAMAPFGQVAGLLMQYHNAKSGLASVEKHMETQPERADTSACLHRKGFQGTIEFKNVSFSYPGQQQAVLRNVSFKIRGEKAFIGGIQGKSLFNDWCWLYQPPKVPSLDDRPRQIDPPNCAEQPVFVSQDVSLFYGPLKKPRAIRTIIINAAEGGRRDGIANPSAGFDMLIGERESLGANDRQLVSHAQFCTTPRSRC